ncbi:SufD family Fe-S cluster assembly protein [Cyanobium sp. HWJ4-Hawea]|uniref:SufD family Fe-S cluster assembly protein n=1 Tax=Cyanobium sp. HWJ4-Hawea TaxID=2823713 RepID=UPI0020CF0ECC|nr:SufD family Fe-S cluster assembly protein [Cyanobium sp. HWJ4-Hawea]MCP9810091.1 SufD family Fe-S cluster assembly protein [Cyanobium sp. HWJ4-Hawea]
MPLISAEPQTSWLAQVAGAPLPGRRHEAWRFTDLALLQAVEPVVLAASDPLAGLELPPGISRIAPPTELRGPGGWLQQLNQAAKPQVMALRVSGVVGPLELAWDAGSAPGLLPLQLRLVLEPGASLELLQVHCSSGANVTSMLSEVELAEGSELKLGVLGLGNAQASLLAQLVIRQAPASRLELTTATGGWGLVRLEPEVEQTWGEAHTQLRSLQLVDGKQMADTHSRVVFGGPGGELDQLHKVVADGAGRSVFNGAVQVPQAAQQTNASQLSRSLLLSDRARVDTKPELEIVADDVKCAHGATVSRLQQNELFYLQSRGIAADQAARLLLRGYCDEVLRAMPAAAGAWKPLATLLGDSNR